MASELTADDRGYLRMQAKAETVYLVCTIVVALLIALGVVQRFEPLHEWWGIVAGMVVFGFVSWYLTVSQGTTFTGVSPICVLGCAYNDCPWMKGRAPEPVASMVASVVAVLLQAVVLVLAPGWWFWIGTIFVGWVIVPHAGLWRERWD